ncbi:MAG: glycerol kinase GlpK [Proteobacteria bacterium]|nr:glycerol kinase GlpK [Pseudomonadota bacterium]
MAGFLIAIDQGTTGSTVLVLSEQAEILGRATREFTQRFPQPGWVEHDPEDIWASVTDALGEALRAASIAPGDCAAVGITNQRETTLLWDRGTGKAAYNAIVWQDRRTAARCAELRDAGLEPMFRERTGLVFDPYFSGTKLEWLLDNVEGARSRADSGELAFGTIDSFLLHRLTAGAAHATDATNASRTLLYDLRRHCWDPELAAALRIPPAVLPRVGGCAEIYGRTRGVPGLADGIPIAGVAGDQQAAMFGQNCFALGDAKCTYGTGAFLLVNTGIEPVRSSHGLITTVAWRLGKETTYALEGSAFIAGAAVQWLRDGLKLIHAAADVEALASQVESSGEVVFVPALAGLGAPYWDPLARGLLSGITRDTSAAHIARAALEGIAFQIDDLAQAMTQDATRPLARLRVDGGASQNDLLMQLQADLSNLPIDRPLCVETTALGAAYLAGLAVGVFSDPDAIAEVHRIERTFVPRQAPEQRDRNRRKWREAVSRARSRTTTP